MNTPEQNSAQSEVNGDYIITLRVEGLYLLHFSPGDAFGTFGLVPVPAGEASHPTCFEVAYEDGMGNTITDRLERYLSYNTITELEAEKFNPQKTIVRVSDLSTIPTNGGNAVGPFNFEYTLHFYSHLFRYHPNRAGQRPLTLKPEVFKGQLQLTRGRFSVGKVFGTYDSATGMTTAQPLQFNSYPDNSPINNGTGLFVAEEILVQLHFDGNEQAILNDGKPNPYRFPKTDCELTLKNICDVGGAPPCREDFIHLYNAIALPYEVNPIIPNKIISINNSMCGGGCSSC